MPGKRLTFDLQSKWTWKPDDENVEYDAKTQSLLHKSYWSGATKVTDIVVAEERYVVDFQKAQTWKYNPDGDEDSRFVVCVGRSRLRSQNGYACTHTVPHV